MKIGVMFDAQEGLDWDGWASYANEVEHLGFESIWSSDHLISLVGFTSRPRVDVWTAMTWLATSTTRVRFGPLCSPITWRDPAILALTAAAVDSLSGGRLEVGIGAGWNAYEHEMFGIPFPDGTSRWKRLDEGAQVIKALWNEADASFEGEVFSLSNAHSHPAPAQKGGPPLIIGGGGPRRTLPLVAKYADDWNVYGLPVAGLRERRADLDRICDEILRNPSEIRSSVTLPVAVATDAAALQRRIERLVEVFPLELQFPSDSRPFDGAKLREMGWLVGTPSDVAEQIAEFEDAGVHRVILHHLNLEDRESLGMVASEVIDT